MGSKWTHKEKPKPATLLEQEKNSEEARKVRTAFWLIRKGHTSQTRVYSNQVLATELSRHFVTQTKH